MILILHFHLKSIYLKNVYVSTISFKKALHTFFFPFNCRIAVFTICSLIVCGGFTVTSAPGCF